MCNVSRDSSVGIADSLRAGRSGDGVPLPVAERFRSAAARLLALRVRILSGVWMFVLCVLCSKDKMQELGQSGQRSTAKVERFSAPSQTGRGVHPASYAVGSGSFSRR